MAVVSRYGVTLEMTRLGASGFPYATLAVNILGGFSSVLLWPGWVLEQTSTSRCGQ